MVLNISLEVARTLFRAHPLGSDRAKDVIKITNLFLEHVVKFAAVGLPYFSISIAVLSESSLGSFIELVNISTDDGESN